MGAKNVMFEENITSNVVLHVVVTCEIKLYLFVLFIKRRLTLFSLCDVILNGTRTNPGGQATLATKRCPQFWNLLRATFLVPRILGWLLCLLKYCAPLL